MTLWEEKVMKDQRYENYLRKWGLVRDPFISPLPTPEAFVPTQKEQLLRIRELLAAGKVGILTGELGSGKTTICEFLVAALREENFFLEDPSRHIIPVLIHTPAYGSVEALLKGISNPLEMNTGLESSQLFEVFKNWHVEHLEKLALIFDDLPQTPMAVELLGEFLRVLSDLPQIALLLNGETDKIKHFLSKTPALKDRIQFHALIRPMTESEVKDLLFFRLKFAGCTDFSILTPEAIKAIHRISRGNPRKALKIASNSLRVGAVLDSHITSKIVKSANRRSLFSRLLYRREEF